MRSPQARIVAAAAVVIAAVSLPVEAVAAHLVLAGGVLGVAAALGIRPGALGRRLLPVLPVLATALLVPFLGPPPDVEVLGLGLSRSGLWSAWSIVAKGLLGAGVLAVLALSTPTTDLLAGLRRLRVPAVLVAIASFMVRFGVVVDQQARSMARARLARGHRPRSLAGVGPVATSVGALFIRAHERGERVHAAMVSRGFTGTFPETGAPTAPHGDWLVAGGVAFVVGVVAVAARLGVT